MDSGLSDSVQQHNQTALNVGQQGSTLPTFFDTFGSEIIKAAATRHNAGGNRHDSKRTCHNERRPPRARGMHLICLQNR